MESARCDHIDTIGKLVRGDRYVHVSGISALADTTKIIIDKAVSIAELKVDTDFNVVKIRRGNFVVSLLRYPRFFEEAFPSLDKSTIVNITDGSIKTRSYRESINRPILHKKELLLTETHPKWLLFRNFTISLESIGISPDKPGLGFRNQWNDYLNRHGVTIRGHEIEMNI